MIYFILLFFGACVFGLCFLVDKLITRLKRGRPEKKTVRQPQRAAAFGILLLVAGIALLMFLRQTLGLVGGITMILLGLVLLGSYAFFRVDYDEEGFTCHSLKGKQHYLFNQIKGEQAIAAKSGINLILFVGDTAVEFSEAMQGLRPFLSHAYYARCRQLGIDPAENPPPAPGELVWFPEP